MGIALKKILYLDVIGGISGDMLVGGLLELDVPFDLLETELSKLKLEGVQLASQRQERHHISGTQFSVRWNEPLTPVSRPMRLIRQMFHDADFSPAVKEKALSVFSRLAEVEGRIHNQNVEDVHFHEVGAWDSIADILSIAICLDYLQIAAIYVSPVPTGMGVIQSAHGCLPIPAPATLLLLQGFPVIQDSLPYERTTPTGAAVLSVFAKPRPNPLNYTVERVGIGIGRRNFAEVPNILRCVLGHQTEPTISDERVECSEANIDDCPAEWMGYAHERLMGVGALDVWFIPVQMKKNRPGTLIQVLHSALLREAIHGILFEETSTLGVRYTTWNRTVLQREETQVQTPWGRVRGKSSLAGGFQSFSPEFEDCRKIAQEYKLSIKEVYQKTKDCFYH
ncbi:nickel pincer cofactor biosynthesis protein LarC [Deltaproteobacteria bacterium TL4]